MLDTAVGFEIGFDLYRFGISDARITETEAIANGYEAARIQNTSRTRLTLCAKKLIQIRVRAYKKGIPVTITEQDLEEALSLTGEVCPITLEPLTYSHNEGTDWSVDRIDNDRCYESGNIVIISSVANIAKNDLSLEDIMIFALTEDKTLVTLSSEGEALPMICWARMMLHFYSKMDSYRRADIVFDAMMNQESEFKSDGFRYVFFSHILANYFHLHSKNESNRIIHRSPIFAPLIEAREVTQALIDNIRKAMNKALLKYANDVDGDRDIMSVMSTPKCRFYIGDLFSTIVNKAADDNHYRETLVDDFMFSFKRDLDSAQVGTGEGSERVVLVVE